MSQYTRYPDPASGIKIYPSVINFPVNPGRDGVQAVAADTNTIYIYDTSIPGWAPVANPGAVIAITGLQADVSATGPGVVNATVNSVGGASAVDIATSVSDTQAATDLSTASTLMKRDASSKTALKGLKLDGATSGTLTIDPPAAVTSYGVVMPAAQGAASSVLQNDGLGNLSWVNLVTGVSSVSGTAPIVSSGGSTPAISINDFTGATSLLPGTKGAVVAPAAGDEGKFLRGDATWQTIPSPYPSQTGNVDKVLVTDGTSTSWQFAGLGAGSLGTRNVILGRGKPAGLTGEDNILMGVGAGNLLTTGLRTIAIGTNSLASLTTRTTPDSGIVAIGYEALQSFSNATRNPVAIGYKSARVNNDANLTAVGAFTFSDVTGGGALGSVAVGHAAGKGQSGSNNVFVGERSGEAAGTGSGNVGVGRATFFSLTSGANNIAIGLNSAFNLTTGSNNVIVGGEAFSNGSHAIALGYLSGANTNEFAVGSATSQINTMLLGRGGASQTVANAVTIMTMRASGTNTNLSTGTLTLAGSQSTGNQNGGDVIIATAPAGASGSTLNAHVERLRVTAANDLKLSCGLTVKSLHAQAGTANVITVSVSDYYVGVDCSGAAKTVNLPAAATAGAGKTFVIKDETGSAATNNITIDADGAETIDGAATYVMAVNYESVTVVCNGTNWFIV